MSLTVPNRYNRQKSVVVRPADAGRFSPSKQQVPIFQPPTVMMNLPEDGGAGDSITLPNKRVVSRAGSGKELTPPVSTTTPKGRRDFYTKTKQQVMFAAGTGAEVEEDGDGEEQADATKEDQPSPKMLPESASAGLEGMDQEVLPDFPESLQRQDFTDFTEGLLDSPESPEGWDSLKGGSKGNTIDSKETTISHPPENKFEKYMKFEKYAVTSIPSGKRDTDEEMSSSGSDSPDTVASDSSTDDSAGAAVAVTEGKRRSSIQKRKKHPRTPSKHLQNTFSPESMSSSSLSDTISSSSSSDDDDDEEEERDKFDAGNVSLHRFDTIRG